MSLIRPEDFVNNGTVLNPYWAQLLSTVDQFDQLMELCTLFPSNRKKINSNQHQIIPYQAQFKDSLRYEGQVPKQQICFIDISQFSSIFKGYHHQIVDIIQKIVLQPKIVAQLLGNFIDKKRVKFEDFLQNIVFNIYPYYLPKSKKAPMIQFVNALFEKWPYSTELVRPTHYTLVDQAIGGLMKAPEIVCYIQKIVSFFLHESSKCKMSAFAFDDQAICNQIQIKKQANATFSLYNQEKPQSLKDKIKGFFKRERKNTAQLIQSRVSMSSEQSTNQFSFISQEGKEEQKSNVFVIMQKRQEPIFQLIFKTAQYIINQEMPIFLCRLLACFDRYLDRHCENQQQNRLKHYCYFLLTNLILAQLHNKFTASHQEEGMAPADLQNISEIIKFLNGLFQGFFIESDKFRVKPFQQIGVWKQKIQAFYANALSRGRMEQSDEGQLLQNLLVHYEHSVVLSMNDLNLIIKMLTEIPQNSKFRQYKRMIEFLDKKQASELFQDKDPPGLKKKLKLKKGSFSFEHAYLTYEGKNPSMKQIIDFYLTIDQPITEIPVLRQIFLGESNLEIQQTLEIENDFKLIQKLPLKELRGYLGKIAHKFKDLRVKDCKSLQQKFQESFKSTLARSLRRKEWLLYYRAELGRYLGGESSLMKYFTRQLNSAQFYERMANSFCLSAKLKIYLNIQDNIFCVHQSAQELKKIQISTLMVSKDDAKSNSSNENYILRNSFKIFETYHDIVRCLSKNEITMMALINGRKVDEFNSVFQQISDIIVSKIGQFVAKRQILQMLSQQKLAIIVVKSMQDKIMSKFLQQRLANEKDKQLYEKSLKINKQEFWKKDLEIYQLDRQFIASQGVEKFKIMIEESNVSNKLQHLGEFFKIIFTILGFTLPKTKINAEIVNPLVQYIILQCSQLKHHECLFSIQALKWKETPQDIYQLTLYQSALTYIREMMAKDYPL